MNLSNKYMVRSKITFYQLANIVHVLMNTQLEIPQIMIIEAENAIYNVWHVT